MSEATGALLSNRVEGSLQLAVMMPSRPGGGGGAGTIGEDGEEGAGLELTRPEGSHCGSGVQDDSSG